MLKLRFLRLDDEPRLQEIWRAKGINADLPLPSKDSAVGVSLVGEDDGGVVQLAILLRFHTEAHLVVSDVVGAGEVRRAARFAEGATMGLAERMNRHGFPMVTDIEAHVPKKMSKMLELMEILGFQKSPSGWVNFWKPFGR